VKADSPRWVEITPSEYPWEREALAFVRGHLPDHDPYHAWTNFEFITSDGTINEVDLLVLTPTGFFLVEVKSRPGEVTGDAGTWAWTSDGRTRHLDNPLILANRKAKRLKSLLTTQRAAKGRTLPFLQPLIFLSADDLVVRLPDAARQHIWMRDTDRRPGIIHALTRADARRHARVDRPAAQVLARSLSEAGIRESRRKRQVGDYVLGNLIGEGPGYQDFDARHVALTSTRRRVRIYGVTATSSDDREVIARAARREFSLLEGIHHPGIVRAADYKEHQLGPALIYEYDPEAERLDHYLEKRRDSLTIDDRLHIIRELAETLKYAHDKGLVHRALSPRSVVIANPESPWPQPQILDWNVGFQIDASEGHTAQATSHAEALVEEAAVVYMAPEALTEPSSGVALDVFSLGAITFHIFTGNAPASSLLELTQTLKDQGGLRISSALDGAPESLEELVQFATSGDLLVRTESVADFLEGLTRVEAELTAPEQSETVSALAAKAGDLIADEYLVVKRLGSGSTAIALLVEAADDDQYVLKVARAADQDARLRDEGEVLAKLRHHRVVELERIIAIDGRTALVLSNAGEETLGQRLRERGRLPVDSLDRFGEDLLEAVAFLEQEGIPHRDIKPDNLGIRPRGKDKIPHLTLFDFSLSRASPESIQAGTAPYVDPFLKLPGRQIWDLHAERFAAAVTLYQMATGVLPRWGDGSRAARSHARR
jgi:serine/threonine protein kinase